jgi:hypothetical protein
MEDNVMTYGPNWHWQDYTMEKPSVAKKKKGTITRSSIEDLVKKAYIAGVHSSIDKVRIELSTKAEMYSKKIVDNLVDKLKK